MPLELGWRTRLAAPAPVVAPLAVGDGLDAASWAEHEFGGARLGDARLVQSAQQMAESPMRAITGAAHGARALVKGHYRLIDQPADSAVTVGNILAPHRGQCVTLVTHCRIASARCAECRRMIRCCASRTAPG